MSLQEFRKGDRVKYVGGSPRGQEAQHIGKTGVLTENTGLDYVGEQRWLVTLDDGGSIARAKVSNLELLMEAGPTVESMREYIISIAPSHGWCRTGVNKHLRNMGLEPWEDETIIMVEVKVSGATDQVSGRWSSDDVTVTTPRGTGKVINVTRA